MIIKILTIFGYCGHEWRDTGKPIEIVQEIGIRIEVYCIHCQRSNVVR